jgi:hypothetical protein
MTMAPLGLLLLMSLFGLFVAVCLGLAWLFSRSGVWAALAGVLAIVVLLLPLLLGLLWWSLARPIAEPMPARPVIVIDDRPTQVTVTTAHAQPPDSARPDLPALVSSPPAAKPARPGGLLRMLSGALLWALEDEDGTQPGGAPASETSRAEATEADAPSPTSSAAAAPRPAWVDSTRDREDGEYRMRIHIGPYTTREECDKKLPEELLRAVDAYAVQLLGPRASGRVQLPPDYVQGSLVRETWEERRVFALSPSLHRPMVQLHVLVGFDAKAAEKIRNAWKQIVVDGRVYRLAAVGIVLLLSLTIAWAYLRLDLSTAGRYRWRLRLAAAAALVAVACLGLTLN